MTSTDDPRTRDVMESAPRRRILVVEDDPNQRKLMVRLLDRWEFEPIEAADGAEAIDLLRSLGSTIAVIVLDIMLPVVDGIGVAREARNLHPAVPILASSASFSRNIESDLHTLGVRDFLPKPYSAEVLRSFLVRMTCQAAAVGD